MDSEAFNERSHQILNAALKVHSSLGPGLLESAYQACLAHELRSRGLIDGDGGFTALGRELRERVEVDTDRQMEPVLAALGDDAHALIDVLQRWAGAVRAAKGYPAKGPQELAASATST